MNDQTKQYTHTVEYDIVEKIRTTYRMVFESDSPIPPVIEGYGDLIDLENGEENFSNNGREYEYLNEETYNTELLDSMEDTFEIQKITTADWGRVIDGE